MSFSKGHRFGQCEPPKEVTPALAGGAGENPQDSEPLRLKVLGDPSPCSG